VSCGADGAKADAADVDIALALPEYWKAAVALK